MSPSHTPGPWRVINAAPRAGHTTSYLLSGHEWDNAQANARLIAAAPDLLAAILGLLNTCELNAQNMEQETQEAINAAVIAIVKAKGAQP